MIYPNYTICATMMIVENQQKESSIDSLSCRYVNGDQLSAGGEDGDVGRGVCGFTGGWLGVWRHSIMWLPFDSPLYSCFARG